MTRLPRRRVDRGRSTDRRRWTCSWRALALALALVSEGGRADSPTPLTTSAGGQVPAAVLAGEILVDRLELPGDDVPTFRARARIDAPPAVVWDLVSHCAGYAAVMPRILSSQELSREGDRVECAVTVDLPFPLAELTSVTVARHREDAAAGRYERTWTLLRGDYETNDGAWLVEPLDGGTRTLATYRVRARPKLPVPSGFAALFQQGPLTEAMRAVRRAAQHHPKRTAPAPSSGPATPPTSSSSNAPTSSSGDGLPSGR